MTDDRPRQERRPAVRATEPETERRTGRQAGREAAERRRRVAAIFGDPLPEGTRDELSPTGPDEDARGGAGDDDWLRSQVPPHHG